MRARGASILRLLSLMRRIEGLASIATLDHLARDYGVTTRTIRRDLEMLEAVGIAIPTWRKRAES